MTEINGIPNGPYSVYTIAFMLYSAYIATASTLDGSI